MGYQLQRPSSHHDYLVTKTTQHPPKHQQSNLRILIISLRMYLQTNFVFAVLSSFTCTTFAVPLGDSGIDTFPNLSLEPREPISEWLPRNPTPTLPRSSCPTQGPITSNVCSSGSPYCCSGSGKSIVCGPSSTTQCTSTTICCINTNGVSVSKGFTL